MEAKTMKRLLFCMCILAAASIAACGFGQREEADLVVLNARVFTVSSEAPFAEAVAVKEGRILAVGRSGQIDDFVGPSTKVLDVKGRLVTPGFIDSHCHFASGGRSLAMLNLRGARSVSEIQQRIARWIENLPKGAPVFGTGSFPNTSLFPGLGWPTREILDAVAPENPVVIRRGGGHAVWVNSLSLKRSGIDRDTEVPYGGEIVKDPQTGQPTGILKEAAQRLIKVRNPSTPKQDIERALKYASRMGLTGVTTSAGLEELDVFRELDREGKLTLRVYGWLPIGSMDTVIEKRIQQGQGDDMVRVGFLKIFIDGTIGVRSALMFEPFSEEPGNTGLAQYQEDEFNALVEKAHANGLQVGVHAIGDKGVNWVLNAIERAQTKHGKKGLRHRVEHNTVNLASDTERFAEMGVIASMQPNITGNQSYRETRLGRERARRVDMWRTLLDDGAVLAWGTDWPVSDINPMLNLHRLVTRYPEQRLSMEEAIKYYTYGGAYACFQEENRGTIEVGKLADMVVFSKDLLEIAPEEILDTEVLYTVLGGKIVYQAEQ
jgi:predicted amidohydrolase YtcJ